MWSPSIQRIIITTAIDASKTAICETDTFIGQQVLCSFEEKRDEETPCDSDSLQHYSDFDDFERENELDSNFTNWTILFARRDPIARFIAHFMDYCVRRSACFHRRLDLRCFLNNIYTEIEKIRAGNVTVTEDELKYVPQNWFCRMETKNQRFELLDYSLYANPTNGGKKDTVILTRNSRFLLKMALKCSILSLESSKNHSRQLEPPRGAANRLGTADRGLGRGPKIEMFLAPNQSITIIPTQISRCLAQNEAKMKLKLFVTLTAFFEL
ncbi:hypothetical protein B9Z55_015511 [Caenorhabditis nigoni]|uniref:Uncharacterized protein n=1 Tax=Caenorhabditis nigoni TaxID=1611254 RepID=A0A2G5UAM2_9PELO|nr:hypothetical protein B9Z55_015511 [Caenorhabditis nigoni]